MVDDTPNLKGNQEAGDVVPPQWVDWAKELQFLAQCGLAYTKDPFDKERFERIREIAAEIMSAKSGLSLDAVTGLFCNETGFQTPKMDTRAAVIRDGKILLVKEAKGGKWSLPGGWIDVNCTVRRNTVKEAWEEAAVKVNPLRVIALHDIHRHNRTHFAYGICKVFVLCELVEEGELVSNIETVERGWFTPEELPPLAEEKNTPRQVEMCFKAALDPQWNSEFD